MQNINPSNNVNRRGRFYAIMGILVFFMGALASAMGILFFLLPLLGSSYSTPGGVCLNVVGIPIAIGGLGGVVRGLTLQKDNRLAYEVGESMRSFLGTDSRYTFVRNISKRRLGYIDAVLVGPPGALVFRVVNYNGEWINEKAEWRVRAKNGNLRKASHNPTRECARDVYQLRAYFAKRNLIDVPVYGIVVFTTSPDHLTLRGEGPVIPIAELHLLYQIISRDYLKEDRIKSAQIKATVDALVD
ncbi:MAG: NERD domain-containing protein [Chloroflexi bacterium]|nr:NERD domain-containing protein [Chloroflexota bacterium]